MSQRFDTVIKSGTIIDGVRTPRFVSDIGIKDGHIAYIGNIKDAGSARVLDASGKIVAPGFIDLHTHYDSQIYWDPWCTISGWHGVTSVVIGNCGFGFAPCKPEDRDRSMLAMSRNEAVPLATMKAGMPWDWETFPEFLDSIERTPKGVNVMSYVPLSPLILYVMGMEAAKTRPATEDERERMRALFIESLDAGACGFSVQYTGTENVQRDYDGTPMVTDIMAHRDLLMFAEVLRQRGEGFIQFAGSLDHAIELGEVSGRPVVWNSLGAGTDQHGVPTVGHKLAIKQIDEANARGVRIFAQAVTNGIAFFFTFEDWNLFDNSLLWRDLTLGTIEEKIEKMKDPARREALREEHDAGRGPAAGGGTRDQNKNGFAGIEELYIISVESEHWREYEGYTLGDFAKVVGKHPIDAILDLIVEENLKTQFQTPPIDIDREPMAEVIRSPMALPGISDGGAHTKFITNGIYPTEFLIEHVRKNNVVDLEEAHWRLSAYQAYAAGLRDRGFIREGMPADIIVYDYEKLELLPVEVAHDYPANEWRRVQKANGYAYILVNGEVTFQDGECTGATPGSLLRHGYDAPALALAAE